MFVYKDDEESAVLLYHHKGDEIRYNATLREIFGDNHFLDTSVQMQIEIDYKLSRESLNINCIGDEALTVLDNKGQKIVIAPDDHKKVHLSTKRAFVSVEFN